MKRFMGHGAVTPVELPLRRTLVRLVRYREEERRRQSHALKLRGLKFIEQIASFLAMTGSVIKSTRVRRNDV